MRRRYRLFVSYDASPLVDDGHLQNVPANARAPAVSYKYQRTLWRELPHRELLEYELHTIMARIVRGF